MLLKKTFCIITFAGLNMLYVHGHNPGTVSTPASLQADQRAYKIFLGEKANGIVIESLSECITIFNNTLPGATKGKTNNYDNEQEIISKHTMEKVDKLAKGSALAQWNPFSSHILAVIDDKKHINLIDRKTLKIVSKLDGHKDDISCMAWSLKQIGTLATGSKKGALKIWDTTNLKETKVSHQLWLTKSDPITAISWNRVLPTRLATGEESGKLSLWCTKLNFPIKEVCEHEDAITALDWHPFEETWLASASRDKSIVIWDIDLEKKSIETRRLKGHDDVVTAIHWNPSHASILASGSLDGSVILWNSKDDFKSTKLSLKDEKITALKWHPSNSQLLAIGTQDGNIYLWTISEKNKVEVSSVLEGHKSAITSLSWLGDNQHILTSAEEKGFVKSWQ